MKKLNLILPLLCLLLLASCTQTAPTSSEDMLYEVEGFYQTNPGKALRILDNYNVSSLSEKEQAHYCLLRAKVYDVHFQHNNEMDSLLKVAENYYVGGDDKYFEAVTCMYLARYAQVTRQGLDDALNWELKASQSIEQCHNVDERLVSYSQTPTDVQNEIDRIKYVVHQRLGMLYGEIGNWRESITHLKISETYYAEKQRHRLHMMSSYCLGNSYLAIKEYDSAFVCFDNAMHDAEIIGEKGELLYINNGLANYYLSRYENGEYSDEVEREELLQKCPQAEKYIRPFVGSEEFIHNKKRFCLWLVDCPPNDFKKMPPVYERVKKVREFRLKSKKIATQKFAEMPTLFTENRQPNKNYIIVPSHSSENRQYIPIDWVDKNVVCSNANFMILPQKYFITLGVYMAY